jgi:hypothetical protein
MQRKRLSHWSGVWSIQTADAAYLLIQAAGHDDPTAKGQLDAIKAAAAEGDPTAVKIMTYFTPIAKMVELNIGPPSKLQRQRRYDARAKRYEDDAQALEKRAAERLTTDADREAFEGRAAAYDALVAAIDAEKNGEPPPVKDPTDTSPEAAEGEAEMVDEDYPTGAQGGAPGDIEFTED